jgi:hypothetical protein
MRAHRLTHRLWIALGLLALLTPLGLWLPQRLKAGDAWGEWGPEQVSKQVGFVPEGMSRSSDRWHAPMPDYAPKGWEKRSLFHLSVAYIGSALIGVAACAALAWALGRWLSRKEKARAA